MSRNIKGASEEIFEDTMKKEEILDTLTRCGLNEYESKAYASLVFLGPSKASIISNESKVPQSKIYAVLDQLTNKQLVEVFEGRPKEFKAVEPEIALKNLLEERTREISRLKKKIDKISNYLKPKSGVGEVVSGVWTVKERKWREFFKKTAEMMKRSEDYVYGVTRAYSRSTDFAKAVKVCVKKGVLVRAIGMEKVTGENYYKARWYHEHGIDLRVFETKVHPRVVLVDGKEVLLRLDHNPKKRDKFRFTSLWSEDKSLVKVMDRYVKDLWENAEKVDFEKIPKPED